VCGRKILGRRDAEKICRHKDLREDCRGAAALVAREVMLPVIVAETASLWL